MSPVILKDCLCIGGAGYPIASGTSCLLALSHRMISIRADRRNSFEIPMLEVSEVQINGPGVITTGGGFIGGGFGVAGAIEGMAVAGILNALTAKSKIHTFISLVTNAGELHFHYSGMEPSALRVALADTFTTLRRLNPEWQRSRLAVLQLAFDRLEIDEGELQRLKDQLTQSPESIFDRSISEIKSISSIEPVGLCPSCKFIIPLESEECPNCGASFDVYASWKVIPL